MIIQNQKLKQHELPKKYLKGFTEENQIKSSHIWKFYRDPDHPFSMDPRNPNPVRLSLKKASVIENRYSVILENRDISTNIYENKLMKMEQANDEILTKICNKKSITLTDKERFADYIQLMIKRTTKRDKRAEKYFDKVVSKSIGIAEIPPDFLGVEKQWWFQMKRFAKN
jgi:hypothetical protein